MIATLCREHTDLGEGDIRRIQEIYKSLPYTADLLGTDVFINCLTRDPDQAVLVAMARQTGDLSSRGREMIGKKILRENEPAVLKAFELGIPVRDVKAKIDAVRTVKQDAVPVLNDEDRVIAVLVREKDISESLSRDRKLLSLSAARSVQTAEERQEHRMVMRETHHRIKNNLQMVASILNVQARRNPNPEIKLVLRENVNRVLSIAAIHDVLTQNGLEEEIALLQILEKLKRNIRTYSLCEEQDIAISIRGDDIRVGADKASSIAMVINELICNSIEHAFGEQERGEINVALMEGNHYSTITVSDNGTGVSRPIDTSKNLGLDLVTMIVRDKLKGTLKFVSDQSGTTVLFDFEH